MGNALTCLRPLEHERHAPGHPQQAASSTQIAAPAEGAGQNGAAEEPMPDPKGSGPIPENESTPNIPCWSPAFPPGAPWDLCHLGIPNPPNSEERLQTGLSLGLFAAPKCEELDLLMEMICKIFDAPYASLALYYNRCCWLSNTHGMASGLMAWKVAACPWNCLNKQPQTIVCGELQEDARFHHQPWVTNGLRCYCSAPLLASNGHRLGTVCFMDTQARRVDAGMCRVLNNFGELAVRALERHVGLAARLSAAHQTVPAALHNLVTAANTGMSLSKAAAQGQRQQAAAGNGGGGGGVDVVVVDGMEQGLWSDSRSASVDLDALQSQLQSQQAASPAKQGIKKQVAARASGDEPGSTPAALRPVEAKPADTLLASVFERQVRNVHDLKDACTLVVDTGVDGWPVIYAEETWKLWSGFSRKQLVGYKLQSMLSPATPGVAPLNWQALQQEVDEGERFIVPGVVATPPAAAGIGQPGKPPKVPATAAPPVHAVVRCTSKPPPPAWLPSGMAHDLDMVPRHARASSPPVSSPLGRTASTGAPTFPFNGDAAAAANANPNEDGNGTAAATIAVGSEGHATRADTASIDALASLTFADADGGEAPAAEGRAGAAVTALAPVSVVAEGTEDLLDVVVQHEAEQRWLMNTAGGRQTVASTGVELFHEAAAGVPLLTATSGMNFNEIDSGAPSGSSLQPSSVPHLYSTAPAGTPGRAFDLSFRPMALDVLDADALPLGIPSWVPMEACAPVRRLYAVRLHSAMTAPLPPQPLAPTVKVTSRVPNTLAQLAGHLFPGLGVGQVLGKGGYGTAYTGTWHDVAVVLKVQDHDLPDLETLRTAQIEVALGQMIRHPYLVRTLAHGAAEVAPPPLQSLSTAYQSQASQPATHDPGPSPLAGGGPLSTQEPESHYNPLSKWLMQSNPEWDDPGPESWFSHCSKEDMMQRSLLGNDTVKAITSKLPSAFDFVNAVSVARDATERPAFIRMPTRNLLPSLPAIAEPAATQPRPNLGLEDMAPAGVDAEAVKPVVNLLVAHVAAVSNTWEAGLASLPVVATVLANPLHRAAQRHLGLVGLDTLNSLPSVADSTAPPINYVPVAVVAPPPLGTAPAATAPAPPLLPGLPTSAPPVGGAPISPIPSVIVAATPSRFSMQLDHRPAVAESRSIMSTSMSVTTEMAAMMVSAERHAKTVGAKPMAFPMRLRTFAILEHCDGGTLQDAIDRGWLRKGLCHQSSPPNLLKVMTLASQIACGVGHLHARGVVHADLTAANVLLCTARTTVPSSSCAALMVPDSPSSGTQRADHSFKATSKTDSAGRGSTGGGFPNPPAAAAADSGAPTTPSAAGEELMSTQGNGTLYTLPTKRYSLANPKARTADEMEFIAKVADFGMSRLLGPEGVIKAGGYATVTHMAPEVLTYHLLSPAADVYSLGCVIWQMYTGCRPWASLSHRQILATVVSGAVELEWPLDVAEGLPPLDRELASKVADLGRACMAREAEARPTMVEVENELSRLIQQLHAAEAYSRRSGP